MAKKRKTREEKVKSAYRLANFKLKLEEQVERRDVAEFSYLSREYIGRDLAKTVVYSVVIVTLLLAAKRYLG